MRALRTAALLAALLAAPTVAGAQGGPPHRGPEKRAQIEQRLRQGLWQIAKQRIGFTDEQMTKLEQTSRRYDQRRRVLVAEERTHRQTLRRELLAESKGDAKADQDRVAKSLDRLHQLQRERVELQIEEQREFATFMTPVQRAKYAALQEQVRRRVEALRRQREDSGGRRALR